MQLLQFPQTIQELGKKAKRKVRKKKTETSRPLSRQFPSLRAFGYRISHVRKHFLTHKQKPTEKPAAEPRDCDALLKETDISCPVTEATCAHTAQSPGSPCSMQIDPADIQLFGPARRHCYLAKSRLWGHQSPLHPPNKPYLALAMKQKWPPKPFSVGNSGLDSAPLQAMVSQ